MRKQGTWAIAALVIVASLSSWGNAGLPCDGGCSSPNGAMYDGCAAPYSSCMAAYSPCGAVGCTPSGCGAGYGGGCRHHGKHGSHHCCVARKIHNHHARCIAHRAWKLSVRAGAYANCGAKGGSYAPCAINSNCYLPANSQFVCDRALSGCDSSSNALNLPPGAKIISDRVVGEGDVPTPAPDDQTAVSNGSMFRLTGLNQNEAAGLPAFERGLAAFRSASMNDAATAFTMAAEAEPSNAMYHYYRALAMFDVAGADAAKDVLAMAVEVEQREGVENWGKRMERVQGRGRLWVEKARRDAGLVR